MPTIVQSTNQRGAILNYGELITRIARYLKRNDLNDQIPFYISMVEARINSTIKQARELEDAYQATTTAGLNFVTLPERYKSLMNISVIYNSRKIPLNILSDKTLLLYGGESVQGVPTNYSIFGNRVLLHPVPDAAYDIVMSYYTNLPSLDYINSTNWLLEKMPDLYLYGALIERMLRYSRL